MNPFIFLLMVVANSLVTQSYSHLRPTGKVNLRFRYHEVYSNRTTIYPTSGQLLPLDQPGDAYILSGDVIDKVTLNISTITCKKSSKPPSVSCLDGNHRVSMIFPDMLNNVVRIDGMPNELIRYFQMFLVQRMHNPPRAATLICTLQLDYDETLHPDPFYLSKTGLFGILFLTTCVALILVFCTGWLALSYYRRITSRRRKSEFRKALECSVQKILDKSPIIVFDSKNNQTPGLDNETPCAICLEPFSDNDNLRKLECSHYYHTICIDPWLLAHQTCPLCNRSVLTNEVPSVSAHVSRRGNRRRDSDDEPEFDHS